jgi:uncharacterized protein YndB with AHSA1/START domain
MIHLEMRTMIHRPITQVFDFVSTPENDYQWQYGTLATASLSEGINKKGTAFRSIGHLMGHRVQGTFEVVEYEPNREYGFRSLSGPLHSQTLYTFEAANGGTRITISTWAHMLNFFQINQRLLEKNIKKQLKENLTLLKELLE